MLEYALLIALIALASALGLAGVGASIGNGMDSGSQSIQEVAPSPDAPRIVSLEGPPAGRYMAGDAIILTARWSQPVRINGKPGIGLGMGPATAEAAGGGPMAETRFTYTIKPGDFDPDGLTLASALTVPKGTTIRDADGQMASTALPALDLSNVLVGDSARWAAVGSAGRIMLSADGVTWQAARSGVSVTLRGIAHGQSQWVAAGDFGTILTSPDGTAWTQRTAPRGLGLAAAFYSGSHNGWIIAGAEDTILTSPDAAAWTERSGFPVPAWNRGVAANGSQLVMVGEPTRFRTSGDGTQWPLVNSGSTWTSNAVAFGAGSFVAVGNDGQVLTSAAGTAWTLAATPTNEGLSAIAHGIGGFTAVGTNGAIITSANGTNWQLRSSGTTSRLAGVASGSTRIVATGDDGIFRWSSDGNVWYGSGSTAGGPMLGIAVAP